MFPYTGGFTHDELLKVWKGLFYCMWMQDKPLLQVSGQRLHCSGGRTVGWGGTLKTPEPYCAGPVLHP